MTTSTPTTTAPALVPVTTANEATLRALHAESCALTFTDVQMDAAAMDALVRMQFDAQRAQYRDAYPDSTDDLIVVDGAVVGRCWTDLSHNALWLLDLLVCTEFRRRGIATGVMHALKSRAAAAGVPVLLNVWADNEPARRLYVGMGFVPAPHQTTAGSLTLAWRGDARNSA